MKICSKCKKEKELSEFGIDKRYNKPQSYCKECVREFGKRYYLEIRKSIEHPEKPKRPVKEGHRWCLKCGIEKQITDFYAHGYNTCKLCANQRSKDIAKTEKGKQCRKKYRENNIDKVKKRSAEYRKLINHSAYSNKKRKEYQIKITDGYIRSRLVGKGFSKEKITKELIQQWRSIIVIERIKSKLKEQGIKICDKCKRKKSLSEFSIKKHVWKGEIKEGVSNYCKKCENKRSMKYRKK